MYNLVSIENLVVEYKTSSINGYETVTALDGVTLDIKRGEILAIAGESGCGKSTLAKTLIKLSQLKSGVINYPQEWNDKKVFCKKVQMVFQNPFSSLNPKMRIKDILKEPLDINTKLKEFEKDIKVSEMIKKVGLDESHLNLYPHEFSGGQRQRIAIARALILEPELLLADESVSALDASVQAQIINLLKELKQEMNLTIVFISHDLGVVKYIADRVAVMYLGEVIEMGEKDEIFNSPKHPYTKALLDSVPDRNKSFKNYFKEGESTKLIGGCKFYSRCLKSYDCCDTLTPDFIALSPTHKVKCNIFDYEKRDKAEQN